MSPPACTVSQLWSTSTGVGVASSSARLAINPEVTDGLAVSRLAAGKMGGGDRRNVNIMVQSKQNGIFFRYPYFSTLNVTT